MRTRWPETYRRRPTGQPSPRIALAQRLYATGACPTLSQASRLAGLHPQTLYQHRSTHRELNLAVETRVMETIESKAVDASALIRQLSLKAAQTIGSLMDSEDQKISLDASKDILDRNPETSKTQKISTESFLVRPADIAALGAILRESEHLKPLPPGDSIQLPATTPSLPSTSEDA